MTDQTAIVLSQKNQIISNFDDLARVATAMSKSGFFIDSQDQAKAIVKIMAGQEMGFGPFASMTGVYIIKGKPSIGANLMAAAVKGSGRYNYRVTEVSEKACSIDFYEGKDKIGTSTFTIEDARRAETQNTQKFPRNMLFARAMSNGVKWYCPDVFNGAPIYTPEELGADVDDDGNVVNGSFAEAQPEIKVEQPEQTTTQPKPVSTSSAPFTLEDCQNMTTSDGKRYGDLTTTDILNRLHAMSKGKNPDDARLLKIEMAKYLLAARNRGEAHEPSLVSTATELGAVQTN